MKLIFQWYMYYLAYIPLWISVIFIDTISIIRNENHLLTEIITICMLSLSSLVALFVMKNGLKTNNKLNAQKYILESVEEEKFVTTEFLFSYIFPLFAFDFTQWDGMVLFTFFFLIFGTLCIRHNYLCTNVILDLLGYRIFDCKLFCEDHRTKSKKILSKRNLIEYKGTEIISKAINNDYHLDYGDS